MSDSLRCFAQTYAQARQRFLAAADAASLAVQSHPHPLRGRDGEDLAMDVVRDGPADAASLLIVSSGCHGVEGFCGSAVQTALLHDAAWRRAARDAGLAVLHVHALNPHGFSWWRRTTHENIDLNRNFVDFTQPLPANPAYAELAPLLLPAQWPPGPRNRLAILGFVLRKGMKPLQRAVTSGQYDHPQGLFYGGNAPSWSHRMLRQVLRDHGRRARRLAWVDLHTGLGPCGLGERIGACRSDDAGALARARRWWGDGVTSVDDGSASSAALTGQMFQAAYQECPQAEYTGLVLEFGTAPKMAVLQAMRAEQWLEIHPGSVTLAQRMHIKQQMRDAFYVDTAPWKRAVLTQAGTVAREALSGLTAER